MSIIVACACGKSYPIKEQFAGQSVQCPGCKRVLSIPGTVAPLPLPPARVPPRAAANRPSIAEQVIELAPVDPLPAPKRSVAARVPSSRPVVDLPVLDDDDAPRPASSTSLFLFLAVGFLLLLGGGGATIYFLFRKDEGKSSKVASDEKDKEAKKIPDERKEPPVAIKIPEEVVKKLPDDKKIPEEVKPPPMMVGAWQGHNARILNVGFARAGRVAISASGGEVMRDGKKVPARDTTLRVWDTASGKELQRLEGFERGLAFAAFDPNGKYCVVAEITDARTEAADARAGAFDLQLWDLAEKRAVRALKGHDRGILCAEFAADGRRLFSGGYDGRLRIWDVETGTQIGEFAHTGSVTDVALTPDGRLAVTACVDRAVRVFDLVDKKKLKEFARHQDIVWSVAVSPDGKFVASGGGNDYDGQSGKLVPGSRDYEIRLWDVATGQEVRRFRGHTEQVATLAFSADGRRLLSGSRDNTVRLWHVSSGRELGKFAEHTDWVQCAVFFPDGRQALSGGFDKMLRVWTLPPDVGDLAKRLLTPGTDRLETLREIARYGPEAKEAVPALLMLLADADPNVKRTALETLGLVGTVGKEHVALLIPLLKDAGFPEGRLFAVDALTLLGGDARPALPEMLGLLKDTNTALRLKAIGIIAAVGAEARATALTPLLERLRDPDMLVARAAADALSKLGKPTKAELPKLTAFLTDKSEPVRQYALVALTDLGDEARPALPDIISVLEADPAAPLRTLALTALLKVQADAAALIVPLTRALQDSDTKVVVKAAEALAALPAESGVLPALLKMMEHADPVVQKVADDALEMFPFMKVHAKLMNDGLQSKNEALRLRMLKAATKLGADGADTVPGLIALVKISMGETRTMAVNALGALGPAAKSAGPVLAPLMKGIDRKSQLAICLVLGKIEAKEAKDTLPFLVGLLKVDNLTDEEAKTDRKTAFDTLIEIGEPAVDELLKALTGDFAGGNPNFPAGLSKAEARLVTIQTLVAIGKKSKEPIRKALLPLAKLEGGDPTPEVREAARVARIELQKPK